MREPDQSVNLDRTPVLKSACRTLLARRALIGLFYFVAIVPAAAYGDAKDYTVEKEPNRVALVIGNENYTNLLPVKSAKADAVKMAERLKELKFDVQFRPDVATLSKFQDEILPEFSKMVGKGDFVIVYFSGHGFAHGPDGFLAPTEMPLAVSEDQVSRQAISIDAVEYYLSSHSPGLILFLLDCCRSLGAFGITTQTGESITPKGMPKGSGDKRGVNFILTHATVDGEVALAVDDPDRLSIFTESLLNHIGAEDKPFLDIFFQLSAEVKASTDEAQIPTLYLSSQTNPYLNPTERTTQQQREIWASYLGKGIYKRVKMFLSMHSVSRHAAAARDWLVDNSSKDESISLTHASPSAVERAWRATNRDRAGIRQLSLPFAFPRTLDQRQAAGLQKFSDAEIGLIPSGTSRQRISQMETGGRFFILGSVIAADREEFLRDSLAFSLASIEVHKTVVATADFVGRAAPSLSAPVSKRIPFGTNLDIQDVMLGPGDSVWVSATIPSDPKPFYLKVEPGPTPVPLELGQSIKEVIAPPRHNSARELVDPAPIEKVLADLKDGGWKINWVSLVTAPTDDEQESEARFARLANAEYILKRAGIDGRQITSVSGMGGFTGDGVRIRFFGNKL